MKKYRKNLILALVCFLIVIVLNFFLPRLLPGNPIAYLTGFSECTCFCSEECAKSDDNIYFFLHN